MLYCEKYVFMLELRLQNASEYEIFLPESEVFCSENNENLSCLRIELQSGSVPNLNLPETLLNLKRCLLRYK